MDDSSSIAPQKHYRAQPRWAPLDGQPRCIDVDCGFRGPATLCVRAYYPPLDTDLTRRGTSVHERSELDSHILAYTAANVLGAVRL